MLSVLRHLVSHFVNKADVNFTALLLRYFTPVEVSFTAMSIAIRTDCWCSDSGLGYRWSSIGFDYLSSMMNGLSVTISMDTD